MIFPESERFFSCFSGCRGEVSKEKCIRHNHTNIICVYSKRPQNMSLVYGDTKDALENRKKFLSNLGIDYQRLVCAKQVHGSLVREVQEKDKGKGALSYDTAIPNTDALITSNINLPLAVFTADCLSIFLYDPKKSVIGLIHASWRSTKERISAKTTRQMQEVFDTDPKDLCVGFGPAIRDCCYEVGSEFVTYFRAGLTEKAGHYYLDLAGINKKQLLDSGIQDRNIFDTEICTSCRNTEFFSYRREGSSCGRMMSVIMLK